jgi:beta-galactosidase
MSIGSRQAYCPSSPAYREAAVRMATAMAERYAAHPALALWHVNNEYGAHTPRCYCEVSAATSAAGSSAATGTLDALNAAWGTAFWSQRYGAWEEIQPPRVAPYSSNPAQELDFRRFCSDALLACYDLERDVLARVTPDVPVTTNFMGLFEPLDYWAWAAARTWSPTTPTPTRRIPRRTSTRPWPATSCGPCAAGSRGCSWSRPRAR